jgi:hypothetical protein
MISPARDDPGAVMATSPREAKAFARCPFRGSDARARIFELGIRAQPGMRGGPVFNDLGQVIGVVSFARIYAASADANPAVVATYNISRAVNVSVPHHMLARAGT